MTILTTGPELIDRAILDMEAHIELSNVLIAVMPIAAEADRLLEWEKVASPARFREDVGAGVGP